MRQKTANTLCVIAILCAVSAAYANSLSGAFLFDDHNLVVNNRYIKEFKYIPLIFTTSYGRFAMTGVNYYRPLQEFSYMIDYFLWGSDKAGYHITSVLFHAANAVILFFLLNRLLGNRKLSFLTSILLGIHPVYTSGVTYIAGRADIMALSFMLLSFLFLVKFLNAPQKSRHMFLLISCGSFFLSLLCKEVSVFFIFVVFLFRFYQPKPSPQPPKRHPWFYIYGSFAGASVLYLILRHYAVKAVFVSQYHVTAGEGGFIRFLTAIKTVWNYLTILFVPTGLRLERTIPLAKSAAEPAVLFSFLILTALAYIMFRSRKARTPIYYGLVWFFINYLPVSNIIIPLNAFIAENWIQIPAVGIFLAFAYLAVSFSESPSHLFFMKALKKVTIPCFVVVLIIYSFLTVERNKEYKDPVVFYESALRYEPNGIKLYRNLANIYAAKGDNEKALRLLEKALEIDPERVYTMSALGRIYSETGRQDRAIELYKKALKTLPNDTTILNNLGVAYIRKGDRKNAIYYWRKSLEIDRNQPRIQEYVERNKSL